MSMIRPSTRSVACGALLLATAGLVRCDDEPESNPRADSDQTGLWLANRVAELKEYRVSIEVSDPPESIEFIELPLLNWSNPIRQTDQGAMFLWGAGRPQLFCCCLDVQNAVMHEMTSVAEHALLVEPPSSASRTFEPPEPFQPIPDSPVPSSRRFLRLTQMRQQAARFDVKVVGENQVFETRLLTQPVCRYPKELEIDGAVFAFVQVTDPECLLVIETRKDGYDSRTARVTNWRLNVFLDGELMRDFSAEGDRSYGKFRRAVD